MDKNSFLSSKQFSKGNIALFCLFLMFVGFLGARALSSLGMFLFGVNALRDVPVKRWLEARWWLFGIFLMVALAATWFWSSNKEEWTEHMQVKLPFLLLPLAFHFQPPFTVKQLRIFTWMLVLLMIMGVCFSLSFYIGHQSDVLKNYNVSHILPTPVYGDHISFSIAIAITIAWCLHQWPNLQRGLERFLIVLCILFFIGYLHLLAAKTGILALYLFFTCQVIYLFACGKWKMGVLIIGTIACLAMVAYNFIPTFHNRMLYVSMNMRLIHQGEQTGEYGDVARVHSYDIAERLIKRHPFFGVGAGDVFDEMDKGYTQWYPQVLPEQRLWPHNQFLTFALAAGIPFMLLFIGWIVAPFRHLRRNRESFYFLSTWLMLLIPLMIDPFLEVQFGVFTYLFFLLWQRFIMLAASQKPLIKEEN